MHLPKFLTIATLLLFTLAISQQTQASGITVNAGNDTSACDVTSIQLNASNLGNGQTGVWSVLSGTGNFADPGDPKTMVSNIGNGSNEYQWEVTQNDTTGGGSLNLDGFSGYVTVPDDASLDLTTELTIEVWVKLSNAAANQKVVGKTPVGSGFLLAVESSQLYPEIWDNIGTNHTFKAGSISSNVWTHLAVTWETGGDMVGYVNGIEVNRITASTNPIGVNSGNMLIGAAPWDPVFFKVAGLVDEVRIWNKSLSGANIATYKDSLVDASHPDYANLVSYYHADEGNGTTVGDAVGSNNGNFNASSWSTENAPLPGIGGGVLCVVADSVIVSTGTSPTVTFAAVDPVCIGDAPFQLTQGDPAGSTYSGSGVSGDMFDPAAAGLGGHTINYIYTNAEGCSGSAFRSITVKNAPAKPTINDLGGGSMASSVGGDKYYWYQDGNLITDSTQTISAPGPGSYTVIVEAAGCQSVESDPLLVTGVDDRWIVSGIQIAPNPTTSVLSITGLGTTNAQLQLFDLAGKQVSVMTTSNAANTIILDLQDLPVGLYLLEIRQGQQSYHQKILKQ